MYQRTAPYSAQLYLTTHIQTITFNHTRRPPYAPDASLDAAYQLINHYWTTTYRNSSALSEACAHLGAYSSANTTESGAVGDGVVSKGSVGAVGFACPTCLAGMRLISVTGGRCFSYEMFYLCGMILGIIIS